MIFKRKSSIRMDLILLFLTTTIIAHIVVGEIALHTTKSHFYDVGIKYLNSKFDSLNQNQLQDPYNPNQIKRFNRTPINVWNLENGVVNYTNAYVPLPGDPNLFSLKNKGETYSQQWQGEDDNHYLAASFYVNENDTMVMGFNINHHIEFFDTVNSIILWFTLTISLLTALYSTVIVTKCLSPLKKFEEYLSQIKPGKLNIRIPTDKLPSELETLGLVQNSMLDRLDEGFQRLSDFSSDIAHELRTPLTNITTQTHVVLSNDRSNSEYQDALGSNLEELERINKTINDTLYLAQADNKLLYQNKQELNLHDEISQLVEFNSILAEDKGVTIELHGDGCLFYDKLMFQRAINNLLCNAMRHANDNSTIHINITNNDETLNIAVVNSGDTISETTLPFIFDRFYRGDKSREYDHGYGAGLGLPITKSIVESSGGTIEAESANGTTKFEIKIPNYACGNPA